MYSIRIILSILPLFFILILLLLNSCSNRSEYGSESDYEKLGAVGDTTPDYTFSSDEEGIITYGGSCSSSTKSAISENNTITLVSLSDGTYSDCTIIVTDTAGNASNTLAISSFVVNTDD